MEEDGKIEYFGLSCVQEQKLNEICPAKGQGGGKKIKINYIACYSILLQKPSCLFPRIGVLNETKDGRRGSNQDIKLKKKRKETV